MHGQRIGLVNGETTTLPELFATRAAESPELVAYRAHTEDRWIDYAWQEVVSRAGRWQAALRASGLRAGDRVALCLRNRLEWVLFDQAALGLGLVVVPLYYNDRPDNMAWCLNDSGARILLLEDAALWQALAPLVPKVERAICIGPAVRDERLWPLAQWVPTHVEGYTAAHAQANGIATVVYTSGTTGRPKGVMLTHRNIVADLVGLMHAVPALLTRRHEFLSFLPLSHMFERTVGYYIPICIDAQVTFARSIAELGDDLASQQPTAIVSVPRIFERVYAKIEAGIPPRSIKRKLFDKTIHIGWRRFTGEANVLERLQWPLLDMLVARKLRARLGGRLEFIKLGGAALAPHLLQTFTAMGFTFIHGYGLTETSPVISCNRLDDNDPMSVGKALPGVETRVADNGELLVRGATVMRGYWNNEAATRAAIDADGWLHTGDVVEIKNNGKIYIRGRVKDIIVLSNGEKIPPGDAEQAILRDPAFEQVMVVGEGRPALTLIAVSNISDTRELVQRANKQLHAFPGYAKIRYALRANAPWTVENGFLTATLKTKRNKIEEAYAREIEALYRSNG